MVYLTKLDNGLVRWQSDNGLKIRNEQTGGEYDYADDLPNEIRIRQGLEPYSYVETDRVIETYINKTKIDEETIAKAKAYDILIGEAE
jgi:hypothetical protein